MGIIEVGRVGYCPLGFSAVRCDRNTNSVFKNPFGGKNGAYKTREESCEAYREHFMEEVNVRGSKLRIATRRLLKRLQAGEDIYLQCHCKPKQCHMDTVKEYLEKELGDAYENRRASI